MSASPVRNVEPCSVAARPPMRTYSTLWRFSAARSASGSKPGRHHLDPNRTCTVRARLEPEHVAQIPQPLGGRPAEPFGNLRAIDVAPLGPDNLWLEPAAARDAFDGFQGWRHRTALPSRDRRLGRADAGGQFRLRQTVGSTHVPDAVLKRSGHRSEYSICAIRGASRPRNHLTLWPWA